MYNKKKILILGGTGFIGSAISKSLKKNYNIKIFSRTEFGDLRKELSLKKFLSKNKNFDYIINCAAHVGGLKYLARNSADITTDNILIYLNVYKNLIKFKNKPVVINLISNCFYPSKLKIQSEENWQDGKMHDSVESFGIGKRVLVILSKNYDKQYNIKTLNLILPNAFGPGDHLDPERSHALNAIIVRMIKSKNDGDNSFEVWGSGKPKREWIYVEDVVRVMKLLLNKKIKNSLILNIGQNKAFSINEIAFTIKKILKYKCKIKNNRKYPDGAPLKQLSNFKFKKYFKNFKFTNFESAVNNTIKAYLKKN